MATNLYRVKTSVGSTPSGRELIDTLEQIADNFSRIERIFSAMTQSKDNTSDTDADYVTPATVFQFVNASDVVTSSVAKAAYAELNSFIGNAGPSLKQVCSRFKQ